MSVDGLSAWQRYCQLLVTLPELGLTLDVSRVPFTDVDLAPLLPRMEQALVAMTALEAGSIANPDEKRMVGHYWLRAPKLAPSADLTTAIESAIGQVQQLAASVHTGQVQGATGPITDVLHVGIGGSALGPQLVAAALGTATDPLRVHFVDNTDPDGIDLILSQLAGRLGQTLVVVVSKSGGTPETRNGMLEIQAAYARAGIPFAPQAVAITQAGSKLHQLAQAEGWRDSLPMWDWVGGRTSVLSAVGLLPAALQGFDIAGLLRGAAVMDVATRESKVMQNPAALLALMWYHCSGGAGLKDMVILPYKDRLSLFSKYLQQLVMESLGKEFDRAGRQVFQGLAVYGNKGSTDQHAYVQQLREGVPNFFATFIQVLQDRAGSSLAVEPEITSGDYLNGLLLGTREALSGNQRDSITVTVQTVDAATLGALIALYERAVGLYAELVNINAYHQPGVEAGKQAAAQVLDVQRQVLKSLQEAKTSHTAQEVASAMGQPEKVEWVYKILEHLAANPERGVSCDQAANPATVRFSWKS